MLRFGTIMAPSNDNHGSLVSLKTYIINAVFWDNHGSQSFDGDGGPGSPPRNKKEERNGRKTSEETVSP